jgi:hypothetical protein
MRYVLPIFPFVIVASAKLGTYIQASSWKQGAAVLFLLGWTIVSSLSIYPHSLSYFNELAGGPDNGHRYLLESNIDWGQDLYYFLDWAKRHPESRPLSLAYFNNIDYRICGQEFGIVPEDPPDDPEQRKNVDDTFGPQPGYFALDLRNLKRPTLKHRYFERFQPIAKAGYSIFIYHITLEQANEARREMGLLPVKDLAAEQKQERR